MNTLTLDSILKHHVSAHFFEGNVLVADQGSIVFQSSAGHCDLEQIQAVSDTTLFPIASITKMFTAIQILQLVEEDKLSLSDTLAELLPEQGIPQASEISVHDLLLHISGLPNENDVIYLSPCSAEEFIGKTAGRKKQQNAHGQFNYANIDYVLLGLIIESFDQCSWEESTRTRILERAGMTQTGFLSKANRPVGIAGTFSCTEGGRRKADRNIHFENYHAAGCMYSSAADLLKLDQLLYTDALLNAASKELLYTSYPEYNYTGYSVWTYQYPFLPNAPRVMERRGGIMGANCCLIRFLDLNRTIIILSNNNRFNPDSFGNLESLKEALMLEVGADSGSD